MDIYEEIDRFLDENLGEASITDTAKHFFKLGQTHPNWISVEEELPPYNEKVLVFYGIDRYIGIASLVDVVASQMFWYDGRKSVYHITHWMPLPAFPKKGGNNAR